MKKKVIILSGKQEELRPLTSKLVEKEFEVMVSIDELDECINGNFDFVNRFDLVLFDTIAYIRIPQSCVEHLQRNGKTIAIFDVKEKEDGEMDFLFSLPKSKCDVANHISLLLNNQEEHEFAESELRMDRGIMQKMITRSVSNSRGYSIADSIYPSEISYSEENSRERHSLKMFENHLVINGYPIRLSKKESQVLTTIIDANYGIINNQELFEKVWQREYDATKQPFLSNLILKIRKKVITECGMIDSIILNQKGRGYQLNDKFFVTKR